MPRRSTTFYRKNEADVMSALGFKPTKNSGAGWIEKEDGQNDYLIAQLKSTDAASIRIQKKDIEVLEYNANVAKKVPCFVIQFISDNSVFVMARPEDLNEVCTYINTGRCEVKSPDLITEGHSHKVIKHKKVVQSSEGARKEFYSEKEKEQKEWKRRLKRK